MGRRKPHSEATKEKIRQAALQRRQTPEAKAKLAAYWCGRKRSPEHAEAVRLSRIGKKHSPETLAKMKAKAVGRTPGAEAHAAQRGIPKSPEHRARISASVRETLARKRAYLDNNRNLI